ncbi:reverse transcriptase domain-containing protein [Actinomadura nitritigenes]|uniref:reverse transcriptase domain-containing protein n=1 Tax=Actinomadura nitritigenes TaxID=134602 RepID=UPI003D93CAD5
MHQGESEIIAASLDIAWSQIGNSSGDLDLPDPIAFADIRADWPNYRKRLLRQIFEGRTYPSHIEVVDLPKDRLSVRPLARLDLDHRLTYESAVMAVAPLIDHAMPDAVYSYRWLHDYSRVDNPTWSWVAMQRNAREIHQLNPDLLLARTDVTAFYENIEIDILIDDLESVHAPKWAVETIRNFLNAFNGLGNAWGIPQSYDASGILANLYLLPLDVELQRAGFAHLRYSDDIYIFGRDWVSLRKQILTLNKLLRHRHLTLSGPKTKIIEGVDVFDEFEDADKDAINYYILLGHPDAVNDVKVLFNQTVSEAPVRTRDLKFCLTQLKYVRDDYAVNWLLNNMDEIPHIAREALSYLEIFQAAIPQIGDAIVDLLGTGGITIYPYAQQHLLISMINQQIDGPYAEDVVWELLLDRNKDSFVREFAARYIGLFSSRDKTRTLRQIFQEESNPRVRRALLIACYESGQCPNRWLDIVAASDPFLSHTARYLKGRPSGIPIPATGKRYVQIE